MGAVDTTYTFTATDTITSTKMNNIIDQTTMTTDAIIGTTLEVASGKLKIRSSGITSNELAADSVRATAVKDGEITPAKLSSGGVSWSADETKIGQSVTGTYYVSLTPSRTGDGETRIRIGSQTATDNNATIVRETGANGDLVITNNGTGDVTLSAAGGVTFGSANMPTPTGSAPIYGVRAWAKLNPYVGSIRTGAFKSGTYNRTGTETTIAIANHGLRVNDKIRLDFTSGSGTDGLYTVTVVTDTSNFTVDHTGTATSGNATAQFVAIQAAGNISSASWYDAGDERIVLNFTIQMPNVNYVTIATGAHYPGAFADEAAEDTLGETQLNTIYNGHVQIEESARFLNVMFIG